MKVVQINAVYEYSSTGRTTKEMHEYFLSVGIESHVFCTNKNIPEKFVYKVSSKQDQRLHSLASHLFDIQGLCSKKSTKAMISKIDVITPDVIILRNLHSNYVNYPLVLEYFAKNDIPTIVVLHDVWTFTGHCCYYTEDHCNKWLSGCGNCPAKKKYNSSLWLDRSASNYKKKLKLFNAIPRLAIVGVSDWVANEAKQSPIFSKAKEILRIYNWIDLNKFKPVDSLPIRVKHDLDNRFTILSVAQGWSEVKGLFKIFEVANKMPEKRFILIGRMAYEGALPKNVISVGVISSTDELAQYYSAADVLLVCSVQETFGKVSAEALACGTPVIANNSTANLEIAGMDCGLSFNNNNVDEIVAAIQQFERNGGKGQYTHKCYKRASELFDFNKQMLTYQKLFDRLLKK
ncbi:glycosyltransferase [Parabacteroides goldsteinii]|uniref:glycosyltransferase n=1 Tax=Parabacteroides goldsteinii TaxID=328812 RepID=UPI00242B7843|nr:glycosyltransferase [Parabacteroides goldsteinii]